MDNAQMNAQEIIDFIRCAEKKTPVKLYVREKPGQRIDWKGAHVFGGRKGKIIFGIGCGLITSLVRLFAAAPEGVAFSILFMNMFVPLIDRYTRPRPVGGVKNALV